MPPKPKQLDEKQILSLAQVGCTTEEIAFHLECSKDTLERRYAALLKKGRAQLRMSLRRAQVKKALAGDNTMLIWLGKILLGQKEERDNSANNGDQGAVLNKIAEALQNRDG
jgi:hypothetical protein